MKIATFNANSVRMRLATILTWLKSVRPDILCLQETKVQDSEFPVEAFRDTGYHLHFRGMKAYNGVAILSKREPTSVTFGLRDSADLGVRKKRHDPGRSYTDSDETRFCHAVIDGVHILNSYVPQGYKIDSPKYAYKLKWFRRLRQYFETHFKASDSVIWCGDLNVAPRDMDVHSPEKHLKHVCFHEDVRKAYTQATDWGFEDVFVRLYPERSQYTFWDYRKFPPPEKNGKWLGSIDVNKGWRIDHILATPEMASQCRHVEVDQEPRRAPSSSDHTFLWADFTPSPNRLAP